jgi:peptide deformylase
MILPIYLYGQSVLRKVAEDITPDYPELPKLIQDMWETLAQAEGVGLAAPQIGLPIRLVLIDLDPLAEDYPEFKDFRRVYINAHILETSDETESMEEGCLSLPGVHEKVTRPSRILVKYLDENFVEHDEEFTGKPARVIQHEYDHIEGRVFTDHLAPLRRNLIKSKLQKMARGSYRAAYKTKR